MIANFLKFSLYFCLSYLILSLPIHKRPIFQHLYIHTSPHTATIVQEIKLIFYKITGQVGKFFSNSKPITQKSMDSIKASYASPKRKIVNKRPVNENIVEGEYTVEEKALLKKILEQKVPADF